MKEISRAMLRTYDTLIEYDPARLKCPIDLLTARQVLKRPAEHSPGEILAAGRYFRDLVDLDDTP